MKAKLWLILIRHGESNVTVERILGGEKSCTGLSNLEESKQALFATDLKKLLRLTGYMPVLCQEQLRQPKLFSQS